jgi:hypothetical protein
MTRSMNVFVLNSKQFIEPLFLQIVLNSERKLNAKTS